VPWQACYFHDPNQLSKPFANQNLERYDESMRFIQKLLIAVLPNASAKSMEAE
jgi:hypothetical protein